MNEQMVTGASARGGDFALGFQPDGVLLLHRHGSAWAELGKAVFDNGLRDGLGQFIRQLRAANASGVELVIPEEQIFIPIWCCRPAAIPGLRFWPGWTG